MNDEQLLRYSRHMMLPQIDYAGQEKICQAKVAIVGVGGLGCPAALYLTSSGVGQLHLFDSDVVALENLQRQVLFASDQIQAAKVDVAKQTLNNLNPETEILSHQEAITSQNIYQYLAAVDVVLDCSDNFATRFLLNEYCHQQQKPLISGAAIGFSGQVIAFSMQENTPCYQCLFPYDSSDDAYCCSEQGVLAPLVGVVGSMQAMLTINYLIGLHKGLFSNLHVLDAYQLNWRRLALSRDPACPACC